MVSVWTAAIILVLAMVGSLIIGYRMGVKDGEETEVSGELVIAKDEDGVYPFLRIQTDPESFLKEKYVTFKVAKK